MSNLLQLLLEPLSYPFMVRGMIAAAMVGIVCALVGTYVVLQGMAFFGDALAHSILPGVAAGYLISGGGREMLFWWALLTAMLAALGIGAVSKGAQVREDTAIGIVFVGMFALGIALISTMRSYTVDLVHFLFGDLLGVSQGDLLLTAAFGLLVIVAIVAFYKEFLVISFDPILAETLRLRSNRLRYLLLVLIAVAIVVSLQTVGVALMLGMLITPAATAQLLTRRLLPMMAVAALIGVLSSVVGLYISYYAGVASGAAIVLVCTAIFAVVALFAPGRGWLWQRRRQAAG